MSDITLLSEAEVDQLETFLFSDAVSDEAFDYPGLHGFLCALAVSPVQIPEAEWLDVVFDGDVNFADNAEQEQILGMIQRELAALRLELEQDEPLELPCDLSLDDEDPLLSVWAQGFLEAVFMREKDWFNAREEEVAELMLPIMLASQLFDEPEFTEMRRDTALCQSLCEEIPELITDLYLHYRLPDEPKKGPSKRPGNKRR